MTMVTSVEDEILLLYDKGDWKTILNRFDKNRFLPWFWPDEENLNFIAKWVRDRNSNQVVSIGCGSGFFEWLLKVATGLEVIGIEIRGTWWNSKYSTGSFVPLVLVDDSVNVGLPITTDNSVLVFCYFNNLNAFLSYLRSFTGNSFIGPGPDRGTYTIPEPFRLPEEDISKRWKLVDYQELRSSKDFIAVYTRI